jgi:hypothetical protein
VDAREGVAILAIISEQRRHLSDTRVAAIPERLGVYCMTVCRSIRAKRWWRPQDRD